MNRPDTNINDYIEILKRRKWLLIAPTLICLVIAIVVALAMPSQYRSTTMIIIEGQQVPEAYVKSTDKTPLNSRLSTLTQQIMSRTRLEKIAEDFNLYEDSGSGLLHRLGLRKSTGTVEPGMESIITKMRKNIRIDIIEGGRSNSGGNNPDAFSISYTGTNPEIIMQMTNTLASLFIEENLKVREEYAEGTSEFLISELNKAKGELERQEQALRRFKELHMGALPEQLDANLRTLDRLQLELQSARGSLKNAVERRSFLEGQRGIITGGGRGQTTSSALQTELLRLNNKLAGLLSTYKESYPDVIMVRNRIKELETQLQENQALEAIGEEKIISQDLGATDPMISPELNATIATIGALTAKEAKIIEQIQRYEARVENTPANEQQMSDIRRDYDISLDNYKSLLEKKLNARLAENLEKRQKGERFRIIDPANLPEKPYKPDRRKITLMGLIAGIGIGIGLIYLFEFFNPAFRKPEDFQGIIDSPILTTIPHFTTGEPKTRSNRFRVIKGKKGQQHEVV